LKSKALHAAVTRASMPNVASGTQSPQGKPVAVKQQQRLRVEDDECSVTVNNSRVKGEKSHFLAVKVRLQQGINRGKLLGKAKITCLHQLPGERINLVSASGPEPRQAQDYTGWLTAVQPNARA
jgi:hypothetical protein